MFYEYLEVKKESRQYVLIQERMIARTSNTTRLVDKLLLKSMSPEKFVLKIDENRSFDNTKRDDILTQLDPKLYSTIAAH
jgi:hypothetical protein